MAPAPVRTTTIVSTAAAARSRRKINTPMLVLSRFERKKEICSCTDGSLAVQPCDPNTPCPTNYQCNNGGCCALPMPNCPSGRPATQRCTAATDCPANFLCQNNGCCPAPLPPCPNGQSALAFCNQPGQVCASGTFCVNTGCCPLVCPGNVVPSQVEYQFI